MKSSWKTFLDLCLKTRNAHEFSKLLNCFLTIEEKESIADRLMIVNALLDEKLTQREISAKLNVSIAKITRGSNALKTLDPHLRAFLKKYG